MKNKVQLFAELDMTKSPNECLVAPVDGDPWNDFLYWLEVTGFMAYQAMKYREWDEQQILDYSKSYVEDCIESYKVKTNDK